MKTQVTQGYHKVSICGTKKLFLLECGDINDDFWMPKTIIMNETEGHNLISSIQSVIDEIKNAKKTNPASK